MFKVRRTMRALSAAVVLAGVVTVVHVASPAPAKAFYYYSIVDFYQNSNYQQNVLRMYATCDGSSCSNSVADLSKVTPGTCNRNLQNLWQGNVNDCISSVQIGVVGNDYPYAHLCVRAYNNANYGGSSQLWMVNRGSYLFVPQVLWDNQISSIKIYGCN